MSTGELGLTGRCWRAIWEVRRAGVAIDGSTALIKGGLKGFTADAIHVSLPWNQRSPQVVGVEPHRIQRVEGELRETTLPCVIAPVATIRAAHWASTDRQAALLLVLPVQQRLVHPRQLRDAMANEHTRGRRELIRQLVADIVDGAHSLGELDFALLCRKRGLPEPDRQAIVETRFGRIYLDVRWTSIGLVVEIDGSGHRQGLALVDDNFRQNRVTISGDLVLRFDLTALRLRPDEVLDQVVEAHAYLSRRAG